MLQWNSERIIDVESLMLLILTAAMMLPFSLSINAGISSKFWGYKRNNLTCHCRSLLKLLYKFFTEHRAFSNKASGPAHDIACNS